jgi:phytoene dehydrogenase-like protein
LHSKEPQVAVVGSGPNGLAAALELQRSGARVQVFERAEVVGGCVRTEEITLPGFRHDLAASMLPLGYASPFLSQLPLHRFGLRWIEPEIPFAHTYDDSGLAVFRDIEQTAELLGEDRTSYLRLMSSLVRNWSQLLPEVLAPIAVPSHPVKMLLFGIKALRSARGLADAYFHGDRARALFAGLAAHSVLPLTDTMRAAPAIVLGATAHAAGSPFPKGGAGALTQAMAAYLESLGGVLWTGIEIQSLRSLADFDAVLFDVSPRQFTAIAGDAIPSSFVRRLQSFKYGPGVFKVDWALSEPIPWKSEICRKSGTVHVAGTSEEIEVSERAPWIGQISDSPFVLVTQPGVFDDSRAPSGKSTAWGYCHVPNGWSSDLTEQIEARIEEFAPGFRHCIVGRRSWSPRQLEEWNPNLVGGDLGGGAMTLTQTFTRPTTMRYRTPNEKLFLCSASTPPGGGVHGMCGYHAAQVVKRTLRVRD